MISVVLLCLASAVFVVLTRRWQSKKAHPLPPPLPGGIPIIGHTHLISGDTTKMWDLNNKVIKACMQNGGVLHGQIGTQIYYLISDPDDAFTAATTCLQKHFAYDLMKNWLGKGLLTASGSLWQRHRKLLNPAFGVPVVHSFLGIFNQMSKQFVIDIECQAGNGSFNIAPYLSVFTFETFIKTSFGIGDANVKEFAQKYMESSDQLMNMISYRFQNVLLQNDWIYKLTGMKKKETRLIKNIDDMADQVIERTKEDMKKSDDITTNGWTTTGTKCKPLIHLLLELNNDDSLTDKEIKEEVNTTLIAGFDTTSNTLACILILLGSYPEVQQKMYEEIIEVLGPDRDIEKDDIKRLVYTDAVIKEALRVFPITLSLLRHVDKDVKLKNYTMRAGSQCIILELGVHRNSQWGDDAEKFNPERWFDPTIAALGNNNFYGFSLGKRSCIGRTYAMISMKVVLSHFIRRFRIRANVNDIKFKIDVVLKPINPIAIIENRH